MERKVFKQLKDIAELDLEDLSNRDQKIMIVADLPYNEQFEAKIIEQVNRISQIYGDVKIYRKDLSKKEVLKTLQDDYKEVQRKKISEGRENIKPVDISIINRDKKDSSLFNRRVKRTLTLQLRFCSLSF